MYVSLLLLLLTFHIITYQHSIIYFELNRAT